MKDEVKVVDKELEEIKGKLRIIGIMFVIFIALSPLKNHLELITRAGLSVFLSPLALYGIFKYKERKAK
ncbi:hypothetical protein FERRO_06190 [Ferrovum sp. JA12]|uniref:hypothetical protein n=1 Tax=Ferrovum sp. JA12 TaxID=1356299 RepID=UPI0007039D1E|nr:hypothetical protein [Ferrovum sp. JA12]KRH79551.1 hypothetical protein FERRO_06190 [Ferrovum sp. JA12]